jgi:hypothetical protein
MLAKFECEVKWFDKTRAEKAKRAVKRGVTVYLLFVEGG